MHSYIKVIQLLRMCGERQYCFRGNSSEYTEDHLQFIVQNLFVGTFKGRIICKPIQQSVCLSQIDTSGTFGKLRILNDPKK